MNSIEISVSTKAEILPPPYVELSNPKHCYETGLYLSKIG